MTVAGQKPVERLFGHVDAAGRAARARRAISRASAGAAPAVCRRRATRRSGCSDGWTWRTRRASTPTGPTAATRRCAQAIELGPEGVIREVTDAKLMGRGGAAFPTGRKWDAVARQPVRPHYLICNADESEPGTFKDRVIMEGDPFASSRR